MDGTNRMDGIDYNMADARDSGDATPRPLPGHNQELGHSQQQPQPQQSQSQLQPQQRVHRTSHRLSDLPSMRAASQPSGMPAHNNLASPLDYGGMFPPWAPWGEPLSPYYTSSHANSSANNSIEQQQVASGQQRQAASSLDALYAYHPRPYQQQFATEPLQHHFSHQTVGPQSRPPVAQLPMSSRFQTMAPSTDPPVANPPMASHNYRPFHPAPFGPPMFLDRVSSPSSLANGTPGFMRAGDGRPPALLPDLRPSPALAVPMAQSTDRALSVMQAGHAAPAAATDFASELAQFQLRPGLDPPSRLSAGSSLNPHSQNTQSQNTQSQNTQLPSSHRPEGVSRPQFNRSMAASYPHELYAHLMSEDIISGQIPIAGVSSSNWPESEDSEDDDLAAEGYAAFGEHALNSLAERNLLRAAQSLRGSVSTKMVASPSAISSLQSVATSSLPKDERHCMICYNDFGQSTPEGFIEAPLRIPGCGHVFGDHCIKKWFDDSDSCPYCRAKVASQPKTVAPVRVLMEYLRRSGGRLSNNGALDPQVLLALSGSRQPAGGRWRRDPQQVSDPNASGPIRRPARARQPTARPTAGITRSSTQPAPSSSTLGQMPEQQAVPATAFPTLLQPHEQGNRGHGYYWGPGGAVRTDASGSALSLSHRGSLAGGPTPLQQPPPPAPAPSRPGPMPHGHSHPTGVVDMSHGHASGMYAATTPDLAGLATRTTAQTASGFAPPSPAYGGGNRVATWPHQMLGNHSASAGSQGGGQGGGQQPTASVSSTGQGSQDREGLIGGDRTGRASLRQHMHW